MISVQHVTRQEVVTALSHAMLGAGSGNRFGFRLLAGGVRTFALEVNQAGADPLARVAQMAHEMGMRMSPTADASLALVAGDPGGLFVDVVDPRFWLLHTTGPSAWVEPLLEQLVGRSPDIDWCWLPLSLIRGMQAEGQTRWFKSDFRGEELLPSQGVIARRLKIQLEGDDAEKFRAILAAVPGYEQAGALTGVTVELSDTDAGNLTVAAHYRGGFKGQGDSFELHEGFVGRAIGAYAADVRGVEDRLGFRWEIHEEGQGASFTGRTIEIGLTRRIDDLDRFTAGIFSAREPFRLWATPTKVSENLIEAEVADLHVGQQFRVDVTRTGMRIYLNAGVCANTVFRLLANLQHRFDATAVARSSEGPIA